MKKIILTLTILLSLTAFALAGGDQNKNRHDGSKGQGPTTQVRTNK